MPVELQAAKDRIRDYILQEFLPGEEASNLQDDTPLKSSGILDSVSTLKLVSYVEETFKIDVAPHEATSEFDTITSIAELVQHKS